MVIGPAYSAELQHEMISTRKMLERAPVGKYDWKPHEKSMSLGNLASHIADMLTFITKVIDKNEMNFATDYAPKPPARDTAELLARFDGNYEQALAKLQQADDAFMMQPWTLRNGDHVLFTAPRVGAVRALCFSHIIHHRGQLSVYLRMLDISVPSIYGPSADEMN